MLEHITHNSELLALILSNKFKEAGTHFIAPSDFSQQLANILHPAGTVIEPHIHKLTRREAQYPQEVLIIKNDRICVDFYSAQQQYVESHILEKGDVILLVKDTAEIHGQTDGGSLSGGLGIYYYLQRLRMNLILFRKISTAGIGLNMSLKLSFIF